tara:strand:+ start:1141 stop:2997 length:1857 start_codon:yes stop_codon:yes gene_type:complete
MTKYISFSPYYSGLANVIMSYEMLFAAAYLTKRKVILPPDVWLLFISESHDKKDYIDIWEIFDKDYVKKEFDCIDFYDVPEFKDKYKLMESDRSYTRNIKKVFGDEVTLIESATDTFATDHIVFTNKGYLRQEWTCDVCNVNHFPDVDFLDFAQNRGSRNIGSIDTKFLHFENNLFGHYWYNFYPGNTIERNKLKRKINNCFRFSDRFYKLSEKVKEKIGNYNAVHIRRNDFLYVRPEDLEPVSDSTKLLDRLYAFFNVKDPLYISTDEKDKSFFDEVRKKYDVYFYDDFDYDLNDLDTAVLEQVICSQAEFFMGTYLSTFTKRINVMRGLEAKNAEDDMGINHFPFENNRQDIITSNPWKLNQTRNWEWNSPSHPQWKFESNGKYFDSYNVPIFESRGSGRLIEPPIFSKVPFLKKDIPSDIMSLMTEKYKEMKFDEREDHWEQHKDWGHVTGGISIKGEKKPVVQKAHLDHKLHDKIYEVVTPMVEEWSGIKLERAFAYGVRSYPKNSILHLHRDKADTHILSCIIFVDMESEENWALDFYDHDYKHHEIFFEHGEMLFYESLCVHGRSKPFPGKYYRNMYFHWKPVHWMPSEYYQMKGSFRDEKHLLEYYSKDTS